MSSFFDKVRSGAGKAAFEADKLRRVTAAQSDLRGLREEMNRAVNLIGRVAFDLHQRGQDSPPELRAACDAARSPYRWRRDRRRWCGPPTTWACS